MEDGKHNHVFSSQKLLHSQKCAPRHWHAESTSPGSSIIPDIATDLLSDTATPTSSNDGEQFGHTEQIPDK